MNNLLPNVPYTPFQQFQQLNGHLLNQPYNENNLRLYGQGVLANINLINRDRNVLLNNSHIITHNNPLFRILNQELISYNNAKAELFRIVKGLRVNVIPQGGSRKKGGKIKDLSKEDRDVVKVIFEKDLREDIRELRKLLGEVEEELGFNDLVTARRDLKKITRIIEEYEIAALQNNYPSPIPQDILDQYDGLMTAITRMELGISGNSSNIQFNDADWEFLGAGISREKKNYNTNLRI